MELALFWHMPVKNNRLFSCLSYYQFFFPGAGRRCYVGIAMELALLVASWAPMISRDPIITWMNSVLVEPYKYAYIFWGFKYFHIVNFMCGNSQFTCIAWIPIRLFITCLIEWQNIRVGSKLETWDGESAPIMCDVLFPVWFGFLLWSNHV